ncbi:HAD family hydrolase [Nocardia otitidiscaviarum]|uniref:HAD family hydrolase n=1 Tax=Nocardia otitidiscaviarum TaxID=1823 RepID=UPI0018939314|nr:HAD-IA family hydrolase [Nocardia otitidiscaviarum]MBF6178289.1 HAD family hydrolase [Nocardia otitidiscaviarum]
MTAPSDLLRERRCLLLDFDGPICAVFAGTTSRTVAIRLVEMLDAPVPDEIAASADPLAVLRYAGQLGGERAERVERELTRLELDAVDSAEPTRHAGAVIRAVAAGYGLVAVVSNNSAASIRAYLMKHDLDSCVRGVFGRTSADLSQLKPTPFLLHAAMSHLEVVSEDCVFIGDSVADIQAAHAAHIPAIAYANKPGKAERFAPYAPAVTITDLGVILHEVKSVREKGQAR